MKSYCIYILAALTLLTGCRAAEAATEDAKAAYNANNIVGVDQFGRSFDVISSFKTDKQVGMFFWPWIGQPYASGIYDATEILAMPNGLKLLTDFNSLDESISPNGQAHFWGKPLWGYYNSEDEWVLRKQLQMITAAGVDFIYFDTTNALIYKNVIMKILAIVDEYQRNGWNPPKVVFYTHSKSIQTTEQIYREIYKAGHYPSAWYRVGGKPMIIAYTKVEDDIAEAKSRGDNDYAPAPLSAEILNFFHFFKPQWPFDPVLADGFPWVEWSYPPPLHTESGVMNVTVASHPSVPMSFSLTRGLVNWGRGWNPDTKQNVSEDVDKGAYFQRQWDYVIQADPKMVSVGGWNEWIAYKQPWDGEYMLCDATNKEYSRDIEPMTGGYEDAFYIQLIKNIRRYKGVPGLTAKDKKHEIDITGDAAQWDKVAYRNVNIGKDDSGRDSYGASQTIRYQQSAPENVLEEVRVANDDKYVYFYVKCNKGLTPYEKKENWINILIGTGDPELKAWESYEYLVGRSFTGKEVSVDKLGGEFALSAAAPAQFSLAGNVLQIAVPRSSVGLQGDKRFYFKVAAGVETPSDIMSYYTSGSAMPMGRLSYMYQMN